MTTRVTSRDVAKLARVSVATVSAVVNQNKYVSPELEARVRQAIRDLGYEPNWIARSLKVQQTKTIGLIFTNITSAIFPPLVRVAQREAQKVSYDTFLVVTDEDVERERKSIKNLVAKRVDGIVLAPALSDDHTHIQQVSRSIPVVVIERRVPGVECIVTNNEAISYKATRHLIEHGLRRIGLVTIPALGANAAERISGYSRALGEDGLFDPTLIRQVDFVGESAFDCARELIRADVEAIVTTSQSTALGVLRAARSLGRRIPEDLALFGYDEAPWMQVVESPVSTVRQPIEEVARLAIHLLLRRLNSPEIQDDAIHVLESSLLIRRSCGCPWPKPDTEAWTEYHEATC